MALSIVLSFLGEGATDNRFLPNIAERLIENCLLAQNKQATIQWQTVLKKGGNSKEKIYNAAVQAKYCTTLIIHSDADNRNPQDIFDTKIKPGLDAIHQSVGEVCKNITVVIPITETEAWMLVDRDLLKEQMNTILSNQALGLNFPLNSIEDIADPKQKLLTAIQIHHHSLTRKRRKNAVIIGELYEPISRQIELQKLEALSAYLHFKENLIAALRKENILN